MMSVKMPCAPTMRCNIHDLHHAIATRSDDDVREVLSLCTADLNATVCGTTALSLCLYRDKRRLFEMLLRERDSRRHLDINKPSKDDKQRLEPPLVTACRLGNADAVRMLVKSGADLEGRDNFQHTPLWMATRQRHIDMVRFLLSSGANVNPSAIWTHSPLVFAVKYSSRRADIAKVLVFHGAEVNLATGPSLLYCAIVQGDLHIARLITEAGYNISGDDKIRQEFSAGTLTRNRSLIQWLGSELSTPFPLQRLCRTVIRRTICDRHHGRNFARKLDLLPLPSSVVSYLALADESYAKFQPTQCL